jgi:hypothetical protein
MMERTSTHSRNAWCRDTPLTEWAKGLTECRFAVTVTFGPGRRSAAICPSKQNIEEILRKAIKRMNTLCYGNGVQRKGYSIGVITAIEGTGQFERIHAHIAFEPKKDMSFKYFSRLVDRAFKRSKWITQRPEITKCWNEEWINYTLKLGQESLVPSCCFAAKHPGA